ncbi:MAG: DUF4846 domain-containing protein [Desulfobacterales bacterium]|nr:DUF4846 domain-containing protein [Desulfobacterales bacterium]
MRIYRSLLLLIAFIMITASSVFSSPVKYHWLMNKYNPSESVENRIAVPNGYKRTNAPKNSFKHWLRNLPLKKQGTAVYLHNGKKKYNQYAHFSVVDIDTGSKNLQQCADSIIRLRAEYLYSTGNYKAIRFNFTSGDNIPFQKWIQGYRPVVSGNKVTWRKSGKYDSSYSNLRKYLEKIFLYAGSYSLSNELQSADIHEMEIGDIFIKGGFPGHAVIVADMAVSKTGREKLFLLAQSFMPAQDMHILKNPGNHVLNPWYEVDFGDELRTPEWIFKKKQLKRFK